MKLSNILDELVLRFFETDVKFTDKQKFDLLCKTMPYLKSIGKYDAAQHYNVEPSMVSDNMLQAWLLDEADYNSIEISHIVKDFRLLARQIIAGQED